MNENDRFFPPEKHDHSIENKYRNVISVLAAHRIALWEYDIPTGACCFDDDYFRVLGLRDAGIEFADIDDFYRFAHPDDVDSYRNAFECMLASDTKVSKIRVRCVGREGQAVWLEDCFFSCEPDEQGRPRKLIAYTSNITSRCEKEARIRSLEERNRKIVEALPEFIFILDDRFVITDVLMSRGTILLHPVNELIGADGRTIYSPEVSDLFVRNIRECLQDGQIKEIEYPLDKDGRHYFQARIAPFEGNRVLALIHDVGDRVRHTEELIVAKKKAVEADRLKSVFLATMSHEIRTPLNAIVGFSELLAADDCDAHREEYLDIIRKNSNLLLQLINDILDLSRIESGRAETHFQQVEITGLLEEVEKVHRLKMKEGVGFRIECPRLPVWISSDRNRLTQVLFNFLSNAIKNTDRGWITLGAKLRNDWLELFVTDTGRGIPQEKVPLIYSGKRQTVDGAGAFHLPEHRRATRRTDRGAFAGRRGEYVYALFALLFGHGRMHGCGRLGGQTAESDSGRRGCGNQFQIARSRAVQRIRASVGAERAGGGAQLRARTSRPDPDGYPDAGDERD